MDAEWLIKTLRGYDASFDAAAVKTALANPKSPDAVALVQWATTHLTPDTLLTADELAQYAALEASGLAERLAVSSDLTATHILGEQEIREAIQELNRSTHAITRHTETLQQQQEALDRLLGTTRRSREERASLEGERTQRWHRERDGLASSAGELSGSLTSRILELDQQTNGATATIQQTVDALLQSDDKLLSSLQKLGWELDTEDAEEQEDVALLRETCARLIKFTVERVRTKLDRIYVETLEAPKQSGSMTRATTDEVSALQEELESLYAEILPVAQMSTEQQFLKPALKSLAAKNVQELARTAQGTGYIHECLDCLIDRAQDLMARLEAFQAYRLAATAVLDIAKPEVEAQSSTAAETTPTRKQGRAQQDSMSPVRPQPRPRWRYSSGALALGEESPLDEILRMLAINLPEDDGAQSDVQSQVEDLISTLASRRAKVGDVARNVQESFETAAVGYVADAKLAIQMVRDSILAESPYGDIRLVDPEIEGSLDVLSQELAHVDEKLKGIDSNVAKLRGKNAKRDEFINRWGS